MERTYEIECNYCKSNEIYLLSNQIKERKWRQRSGIENKKLIYYFCISSKDPDYANNNKETLNKLSLICEHCGMDNSEFHKDLLKELEKDFQ
jgi:hypothetical protein